MGTYKKATDLSFLVDLKWNSSCQEWLKRARKVIDGVRKYHKRKSQKEVARLLGMSSAQLIMTLVELRKAADAGMTLEEYAYNGRKFAQHNKEVANKHESHNPRSNPKVGSKERNGSRL